MGLQIDDYMAIGLAVLIVIGGAYFLRFIWRGITSFIYYRRLGAQEQERFSRAHSVQEIQSPAPSVAAPETESSWIADKERPKYITKQDYDEWMDVRREEVKGTFQNRVDNDPRT